MEEEDRLAKLEEEENNPMKALENRTVDSKREMDILDALQDIRARNARNERVGQSVDLVARITADEVETEEDLERKRAEEEDERIVRQVFSKVSVPVAGPSGSQGEDAEKTVTVKRKADGDEPELRSLLSEDSRALISSKVAAIPVLKKRKTDSKNSLGIKIKHKAPAKLAV